ncbi:hypothetical protein [Paenibacillus sp. S150]|uniref:hypothetical protein n=1 Tax=Paenibacillus sp. S150 TaxID=2749826 RepID=UPI001C58C6FD|nr:hypothetical protein [Paenibacillus sp. S150]MBW4083536.1 hypothetical protein [Paenibacillus sp. S150]
MDTESVLKRIAIRSTAEFLEKFNGSELSSITGELSLLIITNFGHIEAKLTHVLDTVDPTKDLSAYIFANVLQNRNEAYIEQVGIDRIVEFPSELDSILLKNAKITPYGSKAPSHIINDMILFPDQIVGLSFINSKN